MNPGPDTDPNPEWSGGRAVDGFCHHCRTAHGTPCNNGPTCVCPCNPDPATQPEE